MKLKLAMVAATIALAIAAPASAAVYVFDSVGDQFVINFNGSTDGGVVSGLTAQLTYTLTGFSGNTATFAYILDNTSSDPVTASRISAFGFNVDPNFSSVGTVTGVVFPDVSSGNIPNGLPNVEFCLTAGPNCAGAGGGGVNINDPNATGTFVFNFASQPSSVTLSDLFVRYQSIDAPTLNITGGSATGVPTGVIPEPATWAMMLTGFFGMGALLRSQRRRNALAST